MFGDDMVYVEDEEEIVNLLDEQSHATLKRRYHAPSAHRVSTLYWARRASQARESCLSARREK
jgi:hypothetical protein